MKTTYSTALLWFLLGQSVLGQGSQFSSSAATAGVVVQRVSTNGPNNVILRLSKQPATVVGRTAGVALQAGQSSSSPPQVVSAEGCIRPGSGLIGWWRAEGNADDSTGLHPGLTNGVTFVDGKVGEAFGFNGVSSSVQIEASSGMVTPGFTIEAWVNPAYQIAWQAFVFGQAFGRQLIVSHGGRGVSVSLFVTDPKGGFHGVSSTNDIPIAQWTHLAGTWDGNVLKLYINGVLNAGAALQLPALGDSGCPFSIGGITNSCSYSRQFFPGQIDEVSLYDRALFAGEIEAIYLAGGAGKCPTPQGCAPCPLSAIASWPGDGSAADSFTNDPGTLQNGVSFSKGIVHQAFKFNSASLQAVEIPYSSNLVNSAFSFEAWVNPASQVSGGQNQAFVFGQSFGRQLVVTNGTQGLKVLFLVASDQFNFSGVVSSGEIPINEWTHLVASWDGVSILSLYVNGALDQRATLGVVPWDSGCAFHIGGLYDPAGACSYTGQFFNGMIDEVTSYSQALTAGEVQSLYNAGQAGKCIVPPPATMVIAWGQNTFGQCNVPASLSNVVAAVGGSRHSLALGSDGTVVGWGDNQYGQAIVPGGLNNVVAIAASWNQSAAVLASGAVTNWGQTSGTIPNLTNAVAISAGASHALALLGDGTLAAWGEAGNPAATVPPGLGQVKAIASGWMHNLVLLADGTVKAWGLGLYDSTDVPAGLSNVIAVAASEYHSLALRLDGTVVAWGHDADGQSDVPTGLSNVVAIAAGASFGLALQNDGSVVPWGGMGAGLPGHLPPGLDPAMGIGAGDQHALAIRQVIPPGIIAVSQPTNQTVHYQSSVALSVTATAPSPLSYQWSVNGTNIASATTNSYTFPATVGPTGVYSVVVAAGPASTNATWQVGVLYDTLAYHLATNAVGHAAGFADVSQATLVVSGYSEVLTNTVWSTNCWLQGVQGLSATCIGFSNGFPGVALVTMVSPNHFLFAAHTHPEIGSKILAFLDTNNVVYWRALVARTNLDIYHDPLLLTNDTAIGLLDADLPPSVGYLPVLSPDFANYLPTDFSLYIQGIGMNQQMRVFSQPMYFGNPGIVGWDPTRVIPFGLGTNWSRTLMNGDSSIPERLLIDNQLVLVSGNQTTGAGPNYASLVDGINQRMTWLSAQYGGTNYQLTLYSLTNWPAIANQ